MKYNNKKALNSYIYELQVCKNVDEIFRKIRREIYKLEYEGVKPKRVILGTKVYESLIAHCYRATDSLDTEMLFGLEVVVDSSIEQLDFKILSDNISELIKGSKTS